MTRRIRLPFAALAVLAISLAPGAAATEPAIAAQLRFSFGAGEPRLSLGLGASEKRFAGRPHSLRPLAYRPFVEVSAPLSTPRRQLEDLRLNGLPIGKRALYADEDGEENGDEASDGSVRNIALGVVAGAAVGALILAYMVADDIGDDFVNAIEGI